MTNMTLEERILYAEKMEQSPAGVFARMEKAIAYGFNPAHYDEVIDAVQRGGKTVLSLSGKAHGALVKQSGRYDYEILTSTEDLCEIKFTDNGGNPFVESMTRAQADQAGYSDGFAWKSMPLLMLFYRTLTQGVRRYCPDVLGGADGYTPEELEPFGFKKIDVEAGEGEEIPNWDDTDTSKHEKLAKVVEWCNSDTPGDVEIMRRAWHTVKQAFGITTFNGAFDLELEQSDTATRKRMLLEVIDAEGKVPDRYGAIPKQEDVQEI